MLDKEKISLVFKLNSHESLEVGKIRLSIKDKNVIDDLLTIADSLEQLLTTNPKFTGQKTASYIDEIYYNAKYIAKKLLNVTIEQEEKQVNLCLTDLITVVKGDGKSLLPRGARSEYVIFKLIEKFFFLIWRNENQRTFIEKGKIIFEWYLGFLSYNNKKLKSINRFYPKLLQDVNKGRDVNRLAWKIYQWIDDIYQDCIFFDKERIDAGDHIPEEIMKSCHNSFTFLQLVHEGTFYEDESYNWCYEEYSLFKRSVETAKRSLNNGNLDDHFFFILTKKELAKIKSKTDLPNGDYDEWYDFIEPRRAIIISEENVLRQRESDKDSITFEYKLLDYERECQREFKKVINKMKLVRKKYIEGVLSQ